MAFIIQRSPLTAAQNRRLLRNARRRSGSIMTLFAGALPVIFFSMGMVIDLGILQTVRSQAQRAADAAALAGALAADGGSNTSVIPEGKNYAQLNRRSLSDSDNNYWSSVLIEKDVDGDKYKVRATVRRDVTVYFAPVFEGFMKIFNPSNPNPIYSRRVSATAVAQKFVTPDLSTGSFYGIADPTKSPANPAVFGRYARYQWGDPYSVEYLEDGKTLNPDYRPEGYSYKINAKNFVPDGDNKLQVQIFDPEAYSANGNSWDEMRDPNFDIPGLPSTAKETTTKFTLWDSKGTASTTDDTEVASTSYRDDPATNEKWVVPPKFDVDMTNISSAKELRLQVQALDGGSENGFKLRAGPTRGLTMDDVTWNDTFGDKSNTSPSSIAVPITADGTIQMNFTQTNIVNFELGKVSPNMAGKQVQIRKFDVDVGSQYIEYYNRADDGSEQFLGTGFLDPVLANRNGTWSTDSLNLPADYKGGMVYARYSAGAGDTSNWSLSGGSSGSGTVRLTL